ncbi:MAG TPA: MarP family serine protease [Actinomycetota bacterium]|nr:MarP family serine protease [Actinomycetota bacterium]
MNWVDLFILLLVAGSVAHGIAQGAAVQVLSYGGFGIGLLLGARLGPRFADFVANPALKIIVVSATLFGVAGLLSGLGRWIGAKTTWGVLQRMRLGSINAVGGAGFSVIVTLLTTWLVGGLMAQVGLPGVTMALQQSQIMRAMDDRLPPAPSVFSRIQAYFLPSGFPPVFAGLEPSPAPDVPVQGGPVLTSAASAAGPSTLKITATGCNRISQGSGFITTGGLVITNAHVVAGVDRPVVQDRRGRFHRTAVVHFDPSMDLAILRAGTLTGNPLPLRRDVAPRGLQGGVLGYPEGGPFRAEPGAVRARLNNVVGRDIYSQRLVSRDVYQIEASVHQGNSGGPFVESSGRVVGVIFASSLATPNVAYALTSTSVAPKLDAARAVRTQVDTGPCPA